MVHANERYFSAAVVDTLDELAEKIAGDNHRWVCCQGWVCGGLLFLNDSFGEESIQEYAVFLWPFPESPQPHNLYPLHQLDSWTVDWIEPPKFVEMARALVAENAAPIPRRTSAIVEFHDSDYLCRHCH